MSRIRIPVGARRQQRNDLLHPVRVLQRMGVRGWMFQSGALGSMLGCVGFWIKAKSVDQTERGHAERRALYVGLWTPTLYAIGRSLDEHNA